MDRPRIDWTVNIGEILSIISMFCVGMFFLFGVYSQVEMNSQAIANNSKQIEQMRSLQKDSNERLLNAIYTLSSKIDRLSERLDGKADRR